MTDLEYVTSKLKSDVFNITGVAKESGVSRSTLLKIVDGKPVRAYLISLLVSFFKSVGD